jgi:hypothetical protein
MTYPGHMLEPMWDRETIMRHTKARSDCARRLARGRERRAVELRLYTLERYARRIRFAPNLPRRRQAIAVAPFV